MWRDRRPIRVCQSKFPSTSLNSSNLKSQCHLPRVITYRNACRACASCYGAFRNWKFPSLYRGQSRSSASGSGGARERTHVGLGTIHKIIVSNHLLSRRRDAYLVLLVSYLEVKFVVKLVVGRSKLGGCAKRAGAKKIPSVTCSLPT
jgi:hypothetical protein